MTMTGRDLVKDVINHRRTERIPYCIDVVSEPELWEKIKKINSTDAQSLDEFIDNDIQTISIPWTVFKFDSMMPEWSLPALPQTPLCFKGYGDYTDLEDNIKAMRDKSDKYFLVRLYGIHMEKAFAARGRHSHGMANFLCDMAANPEFARKLLARIIANNLAMLENVLPIKEIDGFLLGSDWGTQRGPLMAPEMWEDMIAPGEQKEYDLIHEYGKDVWVHSCGNIESVIPSLIRMGVDVLNPIQPEAMDIAQLKKNFGSQLTFWGGISTQQTLPSGSPEEVKKEAEEVRKLMSRNSGYILGPGQSIQPDVPAENVVALVEVAQEGKKR